jgi:acetylornithine deacetylase
MGYVHENQYQINNDKEIMNKEKLTNKAIDLLKSMIETQSFSSEEDNTALLLEGWFEGLKIPYNRTQNNIWVTNKHFDDARPTLLLNSHHDTVKPNNGYTKDPFKAIVEDGKLYGLGSNDAGGCLVSLIATFTYFYGKKNLDYNLVLVASAEEESSGPKGLNSMLEIIPEIDVAIVGEPTLMNLAIAEKGLVVFDAKVKGTPSHAAHPNTDNAIYNTMSALKWFQDYKFEKKSPVLGDVKMTVTQINAGKHHNAVPAEVDLVIDVRVNDKYTNTEIEKILTEKSPCSSIEARSLRLNSSSIPISHPLVEAGIALGRETYGSPTLSDQAVLSCPSLKLGPGDSTRSHTADEYIYIAEIKEGIDIYIKLLEKIL